MTGVSDQPRYPQQDDERVMSPVLPSNGNSGSTAGESDPAVVSAESAGVEPAAPARAGRARRWLGWVALALVAVLGAALVLPWARSWLAPSQPAGLLFASGRIEGRITTLTPKSSARVVALHADEGQPVKPGQLLATLDDEAQRERVRSAAEQLNALTERLRAANTQLDLTERQVALQIERAEAGLREANARVERARANYLQSQRDEERYTSLAAQGLIAPQEAEHARLKAHVEGHMVEEAEEAVVNSERQLALARLGARQVEVQRAERDAVERQRMQAQAQLAEQKSHVADFSIRSPAAGRILTRTVELGERVEAGTPLFSLVDLDKLYVKIYVPEPSIGKVALGQEARVYLDAYPDRAFAARVSKVAQEAEFTPKNVETREERVKLVFAVEVALAENPGGVLKPGMPADAVIRWQPDAPWVSPGAAARSGGWRGNRGDTGK